MGRGSAGALAYLNSFNSKYIHREAGSFYKQRDFNNLVEDTFEMCRQTLSVKQDEYNLDADRLSFFKEGNELTKLTPEQTCYLFMFKHIKSLADMVASKNKFPKAL